MINQFDFCALFDRKIAFASYPILVVGWCWFDGFASVIDMLLYVTQFIITRNRFQHFPRRRSPSTQALFLALQLQCVNPNRLHKQKPHSIESLENTLHRSSSIGITDHYHHLPERSNRLMMIIGGNCFSQSTRRTRMVFEPIITPSNTVTTVAQFLDLTPPRRKRSPCMYGVGRYRRSIPLGALGREWSLWGGQFGHCEIESQK